MTSTHSKWTPFHGDVFVDLVRMYLGIGLFAKAIYFMANPEYFLQLLNSVGPMWFAPTLIQHYVILAHLAGGVLLTFGLLTRLAALIQIPVLVGAVFYVHLPRLVSIEPRQNFEFSMLVLFLLALVFAFGPGYLSLDYYLFRREKKTVMPSAPLYGE